MWVDRHPQNINRRWTNRHLCNVPLQQRFFSQKTKHLLTLHAPPRSMPRRLPQPTLFVDMNGVGFPRLRKDTAIWHQGWSFLQLLCKDIKITTAFHKQNAPNTQGQGPWTARHAGLSWLSDGNSWLTVSWKSCRYVAGNNWLSCPQLQQFNQLYIYEPMIHTR